MLTRRLIIAAVTGAVLGLFCIAGAWFRSGFNQEVLYLFAFWFNRLLMGIVIGLADAPHKKPAPWIRGAVLGFLVSFAFYSAAGYQDLIGLLAGVLYGVIIEYVAGRYGQKKQSA
ncbi:MAG: hypothetical protein SCM11_15395 [Bacillota bacterium]|nr:hypothetical protein [Bacillota bacterium]